MRTITGLALLVVCLAACEGKTARTQLDMLAADLPANTSAADCFEAPTMVAQSGLPPFQICNREISDTSLTVITDKTGHTVSINRKWNVISGTTDAEFQRWTRRLASQFGAQNAKCVTPDTLPRNEWTVGWGEIVLWGNPAAKEIGVTYTTNDSGCRSRAK